jgi:hypothetical protein
MSDIDSLTAPVSTPDAGRFREIVGEEIEAALERAKERYVSEAKVGPQIDRSAGGYAFGNGDEE